MKVIKNSIKETKNNRRFGSMVGLFLIAWSLCAPVLVQAEPTAQDYAAAIAEIKNINDQMRKDAQEKGLVVCLVDSRIANEQLKEGRDIPGTSIVGRFLNRLGKFVGQLFNRASGDQSAQVRYDGNGNQDAEVLPGAVCGLQGCLLSVRRLCALGVPGADLTQAQPKTADEDDEQPADKQYEHATSLHIIVGVDNQKVITLLENLGVQITLEDLQRGFVDTELKPQTPADVDADPNAAIQVRVIFHETTDARTRSRMPIVDVAPLQEALAGLLLEAQALLDRSQSEQGFIMKAVYDAKLRLRYGAHYKIISEFVLPAELQDHVSLALRMKIAVGFFDAYMLVSPEKLPEIYQELKARVAAVANRVAAYAGQAE